MYLKICLSFCLNPFVSDKNECNLNNAGCEHVCNNTAGSFNCDCRAGFQLKADKLGCEGKVRNCELIIDSREMVVSWEGLCGDAPLVFRNPVLCLRRVEARWCSVCASDFRKERRVGD